MRRAALALLVVASAACGGGGSSNTSEPTPFTPDYGVQEWSGEPDGSNNCGDFAVGWQSPELDGTGPKATLHAVDGDNVVLDLVGRDDTEQIMPLWCGNVAGDERPELATQRYTGGAHCCFSIRVDTMDGPTLLDRDLGNYGGLEAKNLDDRDADELVGSSDVLAYFGDLPYAATQAVPLVFAFSGGRYAEATEDFPDHVRERLEKARKELVLKTGASSEPELLRGLTVGLFAHYVLLGEEEEGLDVIDRTASSDEARWLREHADEAAALVSGEATPAPK